MYPFLHFGRFTLPTFGLMLSVAAIAAGFLLFRNLRRYGLQERADAVGVIAIATIAGVIGAKLWHVLQDPSELMAHPEVLIDRAGLAWFGGLVGGLLALWLQARGARLRGLTLLDLCSPSAALGYGLGRIGCLLAGDGDYGRASSLPWAMAFPHGVDPVYYPVHPAPAYEFLDAAVIAWILWKRSAPAGQRLRHPGQITGEYLLLSGFARFLVEIIRINPKLYFGMSNAQVAAILSMVAGVGLMVWSNRREISSLTLSTGEETAVQQS